LEHDYDLIFPLEDLYKGKGNIKQYHTTIKPTDDLWGLFKPEDTS
jgi:hypothetical protein